MKSKYRDETEDSQTSSQAQRQTHILMKTDQFYPQQYTDQQLPYGLIFQPFAQDKQLQKVTESLRCEQCGAFINSFCKQTQQKIICNFCSHTSKASILPSEPVMDFLFPTQNSLDVTIIFIIEACEKGFDLVYDSFKKNLFYSMMKQIDNLKVGFIFFGEGVHFISTQSKIEILTYTDNYDEQIFQQQFLLKPFKEVYLQLKQAFTDQKFKQQILGLQGTRTIQISIEYAQLILNINQSSLNYGSFVQLVSFGPDFQVDWIRDTQDEVDGPNPDYLKSFIPLWNLEGDYVFDIYIMSDKFVDLINYRALSIYGSIQLFETDNPTFEARFFDQLVQFPQRVFNVNIKIQSSIPSKVLGPVKQVDSNYYISPSCLDTVYFAIQLFPDIKLDKKQKVMPTIPLQIVFMFLDTLKRRTMRIVTCEIHISNDSQQLQKFEIIPKLLLTHRVAAQQSIPEIIETNAQISLKGGIFFYKASLQNQINKFLWCTRGQFQREFEKLAAGLFNIICSDLLKSDVRVDKRVCQISYALNNNILYALNVIQPCVQICPCLVNKCIAGTLNLAWLEKNSKQAKQYDYTQAVAVFLNQAQTKIIIIINDLEEQSNLRDSISFEPVNTPRMKMNSSQACLNPHNDQFTLQKATTDENLQMTKRARKDQFRNLVEQNMSSYLEGSVLELNESQSFDISPIPDEEETHTRSFSKLSNVMQQLNVKRAMDYFRKNFIVDQNAFTVLRTSADGELIQDILYESEFQKWMRKLVK
ncbi:Conserved_hypothetical protein [Hexamita inflata]|uniref:Zinc finger Sec23/Sec24-type domain-containing protein n=1 Tax=Hexamita inflata TaxID=28002 RepID=A0AA86NCD8_9EUKA|nr:Conserved hypothetical protein [Hexamita inflata]